MTHTHNAVRLWDNSSIHRLQFPSSQAGGMVCPLSVARVWHVVYTIRVIGWLTGSYARRRTRHDPVHLINYIYAVRGL